MRTFFFWLLFSFTKFAVALCRILISPFTYRFIHPHSPSSLRSDVVVRGSSSQTRTNQRQSRVQDLSPGYINVHREEPVSQLHYFVSIRKQSNYEIEEK